eukprot:TRINITY_DN50418_c0_g1_i1.p1 TRINITY_DN50418_c0_g1~~TRINITY_DN50418_c0_g1_i1.p1  ORF type:complete len:487 (+),score=124.24 TRINITY_DN50418_c0_g1_i1:121-1461(+)
MFRCLDGSTKETPSPSPQTPADVRRLFSEGWSIQWLQPQQEHNALASLVSVLESEFGCLVGVNAYLTPPGAQGLAPHWDDVEVFVLQLGGCKSWKLHRSTSASPLPPEAQCLPRYSSGDLELSSLSPTMMEPKLKPGDLLYFPRGVIHHAPNQDAKQASVHLTISAFQRQTLFDLVQKSFEEAMSELWEEDEALRRTLPWGALSPGSPALGGLRSAVAKQLRLLADAVESEAAGKAEAAGPVAGALAELGAEFVKHRMPPMSKAEEEEDCMSLVTPSSRVVIVDASSLALLPLPGTEDGSARLLHHLGNSRRDHMMKHPESEQQGSALSSAEEGEEEELEEDDEEEGQEEDEEENREDDSEQPGIPISGHVALALRQLCGTSGRAAVPLEAALQEAKVPKSSWSDVCRSLTTLVALGLARVEEETKGSDQAKGGPKKKRKKHAVSG